MSSMSIMRVGDIVNIGVEKSDIGIISVDSERCQNYQCRERERAIFVLSVLRVSYIGIIGVESE